MWGKANGQKLLERRGSSGWISEGRKDNNLVPAERKLILG